jgi:hypothetical protein
MTTILVAKELILVIMDKCDYKPYNGLKQVAKKTSCKKLHEACIITLVVAYHL